MNDRTFIMMICMVGVALAGAGCASTGSGHGGHAVASPSAVNQLVAVMAPTDGNTTHGTVTFTAVSGGVKAVANIKGLSPNGTHAIHVHQFGDVRGSDGKSAGGHYNPAGHDHGLPAQSKRHAGDLGNLTADFNGDAQYEITVSNITLTGRNAIIGRGVIIHAKADDGGQPTGNAGARISMGVIGVAKP